MRGSLKRRYKGSWSIILDLGYQVDPTTGERKRKQKWITVRGTKRDAERKLAELVHRADTGTFIEPSKVTVGEWLDAWLEKAIKPPRRTLRAYETYRSVITKHLKPKLGAIRLQDLRAIDVERYHAEFRAGTGHRRATPHPADQRTQRGRPSRPPPAQRCHLGPEQAQSPRGPTGCPGQCLGGPRSATLSADRQGRWTPAGRVLLPGAGHRYAEVRAVRPEMVGPGRRGSAYGAATAREAATHTDLRACQERDATGAGASPRDARPAQEAQACTRPRSSCGTGSTTATTG